MSLCCRECACPPFARETHPVAGLTERSMLEGAGAFFVSHSSYPRCPWRSYKELRLLLIFRMGGGPYDLDIYTSSDKQHNLGELPGSTTL